MRTKHIVVAYGLIYVAQLFIGSLTTFSALAPNMILVLAIIGIFSTEKWFSWIAVAGIFLTISDMFFNMYVGASLLALLLTAFSIMGVRRVMRNDYLVGNLVAVVVGSWVYYSVFWLIYYMGGAPYAYMECFFTWVYQGPLNIVTGVICYFLIGKFEKNVRGRDSFRYY